MFYSAAVCTKVQTVHVLLLTKDMCTCSTRTCSANRLKDFTEAFARGQEILKNGGTALDAVQEVLYIYIYIYMHICAYICIYYVF